MLTPEQKVFVESKAQEAIAKYGEHIKVYGRLTQGGYSLDKELYNTPQAEYFRDIVRAHFQNLEGFISEIKLNSDGRYLDVRIVPI
ncbi:hypothetical protein [Pseudoalteromonas luteoviolacea]|uniref:Uncharacterized protein n=2 Tax=Pseudoalteromonas luteoviolacea TaxID=43657 RepID=A0A161YYH8_9GAMM|nr:hypothetical protein [Pseudoalteromonas luteoviolacea]KZN50018.1 hypothetical protein N476_16865 [Pseudoalteromonas luteoviolacea H33]KZN68310.1 hypothetical protein N473_07755 [Pseudoalteromonas luteoviolacea CPMOR-1]KZN76408.1 hypothetical protein N477_17020 [Pseudoalteromonas luteoviolacea H33-S]